MGPSLFAMKGKTVTRTFLWRAAVGVLASGWLAAGAVFFTPLQEPWREEYGFPARVTPVLDHHAAVGQSLTLPGAHLDRLVLVFATYLRQAEGPVTLTILKGGQPPAGEADLGRRRLVRLEIEGRSLVDNHATVFELPAPLLTSRQEQVYLVVRHRPSSAQRPLSLWLARPADQGPPLAHLLNPRPDGSFQAAPAEGHLVLSLSFASRPSLADYLAWQVGGGGIVLLGAVFLGLLLLFGPALPAASAARPGQAPEAPARITPFDLAFYLLLAAAGAAAWLTGGDHGLTFDEGVHQRYGELVWRFYLTWGQDRSAAAYENLYYYGGAFDGLVALVQSIWPGREMAIRHLLTALTGLVGVGGCFKMTRLLAGPRAAFCSALLLLLMPLYSGHMFINSKDIPFAAGYAWSVYYLLRLVDHLPKPPLRLCLRLGLAVGLACGVRVGGLALILYLALILGLVWLRRLRHGAPWPELGRLGLGLIRSVLLPAGLTAYLVMLALWPWALLDPLTHPFQALKEISKFSGFSYPVLFRGGFQPPTALPLDYLPRYLFIQMPEAHLVLLALGTFLLTARAFGGKGEDRSPRPSLRGPLLALALLSLPLLAVANRATLYDGARHFIFLLPLLASLAGISLEGLLGLLRDRPPWLKSLLAGLAGLWLAGHLSLLVGLHPHHYVYYNRSIGGLPGAHLQFETDYWGNSIPEAVTELTRHLLRRHGPEFDTLTFNVHGCGPQTSYLPFFPPNFQWRDREEFNNPSSRREVDFYIAPVRPGVCPLPQDDSPLLTVSRLNTPLGYVFDLRRRRE